MHEDRIALTAAPLTEHENEQLDMGDSDENTRHLKTSGEGVASSCRWKI